MCGEGEWIVLAREFRITCNNCELDETVGINQLASDDPLGLAEIISLGPTRLMDRLKKEYSSQSCPASRSQRHSLFIEPGGVDRKWSGYIEFMARDLPNPASPTQVEFNYIPLIVLGRKAIRLRDRRSYKIMGVPIPIEKGKKLALLLQDFEPIVEDFHLYQPSPEDIDDFKRFFNFGSLNEMLLTMDLSIAPQIKEAALAKLTTALILHSQLHIEGFTEEKARGWLRGAFYGDTRTGKGSILRYITEYIKIGENVRGETASRTGLLYFIDTERRLIVWGVLVQNDGGFVAIEGLHGIYSQELTEHREALDSGVIHVERYARGLANCRTRIIADMNPTTTMDIVGMYWCQGLLKLPSFTHKAELTRWDIWIPFFQGQASAYQIAYSRFGDPMIPHEVFRKHVMLAWKSLPQELEDGVLEDIEKFSETVIEQYASSKLPIVNNEFKKLMFRVVAAFASFCHGYDADFTKLVVTHKHVELGIEYFKKLFELLELKPYVVEERARNRLELDEIQELVDSPIFHNRYLSILRELRHGSVALGDLAEIIKLDKKACQNYTRHLRTKGFLYTDRQGYNLTARGFRFLKHLSIHKDQFDRIIERDIPKPVRRATSGTCAACGKEGVLSYIVKVDNVRICGDCADETIREDTNAGRQTRLTSTLPRMQQQVLGGESTERRPREET